MSGRVLMGCYEVPGYGGAATASYRLFENFQRDGMDVSYLNIIDVEDVDYLRYRFGENRGNPRKLKNVGNCELGENLFDPHPGLERMIEELNPSLLLADDYIAALLMKLAAPERRLIFMTAGVAQVMRYLDQRKRKDRFTIEEGLRAARGGLKVFHAQERQAMEMADLVITHSELTRELVLEYFPLCSGKVYSRVAWRAEWIVQDALPFAGQALPFGERDIDVIFIASSWGRTEKNLPLLKEIVSRCKDLRIHVVGEMPGRLSGPHCHGLVADRAELFGLLGRSKVIVSPSQFDSAPGILWEASVMGCNIVASRACGNWMLCHDELLAESNQPDDFAGKIRRALRAKLHDNMEFFMGASSYDDLVETITLEAGR